MIEAAQKPSLAGIIVSIHVQRQMAHDPPKCIIEVKNVRTNSL
jgi:hypothetical protein